MRLALILLLCAASLPAQTTSWKLVWSDEFAGAANSAPDPVKWNYDLGGGGWGNNERQVYTNSTNNAFQDGNGNLIIRAISANGGYTSARLKTLDRFAFTYGKVVGRLKVPYAQGVWPAFWMLGANISQVGWPACGEIDIMENFGRQTGDESRNRAAVHGPGYSGGNPVSAVYNLPGAAKVAEDFHVYAVEWGPNSIEFSVDGKAFLKVTPASIPSGAAWPFDKPHFILLNLAIGGNPSGYPDATTPFPQDYVIDYVRVYQAQTVAVGTPSIAPLGVVQAATFGPELAAGGLATVYGENLAGSVTHANELYTGSAFATATQEGVRVQVNGQAAPLTYVSPGQINFQIPWGTPRRPATVDVEVVRGGASSFAEPVTVAATAPGVFQDFSAGTALVTGCTPGAGAACTLWGNGFGPKNGAQRDGAPPDASVLANLMTPGPCGLTIGGQAAQVLYCGAAPGLVIDQLNFVYPDIAGTASPAEATLTIGGATGRFRIPVR